MKIKTTPVSFLWSVIKPYKYLYLIMMMAPFANGFHPILYNYAVKLLLDLFTQNEQITFAQSYKPVIWFIAAQAILDIAWRAHNFAQLKAMPYILQDMMNKICTHCFNLPYTYFQNNLSGSIVGRARGVGDNYYKMHQAIEWKLSKPLLITLFSGITLAILILKYLLLLLLLLLFIYRLHYIFLPNLLKWSRLNKILGIIYLV